MKKNGTCGKRFLVTQLHGIEAVCLRPFTEHMGWKIEDVKQSIDIVTQQLKSVAMDKAHSKGIGFIVKILVGMKPIDEGMPEVDMPDEESIKTVSRILMAIWG